MFLLAFIFSIISGFLGAIGLSNGPALQKAFRRPVSTFTSQLLLTCGLLLGFADIAASAYFFVLSNTIIIIISWALVFGIMRFVVEIMSHHE